MKKWASSRTNLLTCRLFHFWHSFKYNLIHFDWAFTQNQQKNGSFSIKKLVKNAQNYRLGVNSHTVLKHAQKRGLFSRFFKICVKMWENAKLFKNTVFSRVCWRSLMNPCILKKKSASSRTNPLKWPGSSSWRIPWNSPGSPQYT